jgi:hypothetical protein
MRQRIYGSIVVTVVVTAGLVTAPIGSLASASAHRHRRDHLSSQMGPVPGPEPSTIRPANDLDEVRSDISFALVHEANAQNPKDDFKSAVGASRRELDMALSRLSDAEKVGAIDPADAQSVRSDINTALDLDHKAKKAGPGTKANGLLTNAMFSKRLALTTLSGVTPTPNPSPTTGGPACFMAPGKITLNLDLSFAASGTCMGLPSDIAIAVYSDSLLDACSGGVDINGATPPVLIDADARGQAHFPVDGFGCVPGPYSIIVTQTGGSFQSLVVPVILLSPLPPTGG